MYFLYCSEIVFNMTEITEHTFRHFFKDVLNNIWTLIKVKKVQTPLTFIYAQTLFQNIFFCAPQKKKKSYAALEIHEGE